MPFDYKKEYGMTCVAMAAAYGGTHQRYSYLHAKGRLGEFLDDPDSWQCHKKNTSKYRRLYGMTIRELAAKYQRSYAGIHCLHKRGLLAAMIESPDCFQQGHTTEFSVRYGKSQQELACELGFSQMTVSDLYKCELLDMVIVRMAAHETNSELK